MKQRPAQNILKSGGPWVVLLAIAAMLAITWLVIYFIHPIYKWLGRVVCLVISNGVRMMFTGLQHYWP